jgi:hypothetical protein
MKGNVWFGVKWLLASTVVFFGCSTGAAAISERKPPNARAGNWNDLMMTLLTGSNAVRYERECATDGLDWLIAVPSLVRMKDCLEFVCSKPEER